ncbi:MAG: transposase [Gammaproteobacteria bacterium]|nr:transposase [Gammaproteobacteria bacterium]
MKAYNKLNKMGYGHKTVNHRKREYVDNDVYINTVEGLRSRLKLSIRGSHVHVSGRYLDKYRKRSSSGLIHATPRRSGCSPN